jgi:hypothetical protein
MGIQEQAKLYELVQAGHVVHVQTAHVDDFVEIYQRGDGFYFDSTLVEQVPLGQIAPECVNVYAPVQNWNPTNLQVQGKANA